MRRIAIIALLAGLFACQPEQKNPLTEVSSPNDNTKITFYLTEEGKPAYYSSYQNKSVIDSSALGFILGDSMAINEGLTIVSTSTNTFDDTWEQPWGEQRLIRNNYNELTINLQNPEGLKLNVIFRAFDEGIAMRYEFPSQDALKEFKVMDELTEFNMSGDHSAWWIPAYAGNRYEYIYTNSPISEIERVHTPFTLETTNDLYLHLHEAALYDYPSMVIKNQGDNSLKCDLVPYSKTNPVKAYLKAPFSTPWRTVQIGEQPGDLMTNYMILNLNEPNKLGDVSWVEPGKYVGVWWEMFINVGTWHQGPKHAANTENVKKYIDFAAANGFKGVLVEGWNYGWDGNWMGGGTKFEFTKPYPDYDVDALSKYAADRGVYIIGHHETGADIENYEEQLDDAYNFLNKYGMKAVKTGYVENGDTLPKTGIYHHGQYFVNHFQRVIDMGVKYKTMIVAHEPIKATGKRRTYPNMVSREGARGQEYNAMGGNPTSHVTVLPFTRLLAGPMDYTPGVFDLEVATTSEQVQSTIGKELALYTVIYAPMQMANDLPKNYEGHPAFQYIKDVVTDWETTKVLNGKIGAYVTVARQERNGDRWFLGSITNEEGRDLDISFAFLDPNTTYTATIYGDAADTHYQTNPSAYEIKEMEVTSTSNLTLTLSPGGGAAISLVPKK
ncbi:glycoside hydrolase family 97 protein [Reichenbachiella sp. MSK19-1]|uniref:glycoside hydrolase family 97 protein n=1 Tax=Reichenbachiella sp. MSK19-1 TaxID=1897631 RepID=UPI000E6BA34B|nr:glycoside hydrolase family 97 protein [Reichenbachiella sp. MSK19-1]RJE74324.1 alpha-glucosidase [Reichenbachiella sp. MSK19-1]